MPPRKSDISKVVTGDEGTGTPAKDPKEGKEVKEKEKEKDGINIEDLNLPKSIVTRLAKGILPPNTQIQGNAILAMQKSATVFVNYLTTTANEYAQSSNRKTIAPADIFTALEDLEFGEFRPRLEAELAKFNEIQSEKRTTYRKRVAADKALGLRSSEGADSGAPLDELLQTGVAADGEPVAKKARLDGEGIGGEEEDIEIEDEMLVEEEQMEQAEEEYEEDNVAETESEAEVGAGDEEGWAVREKEEDERERGAGDVEDEALDDGGDSD